MIILAGLGNPGRDYAGHRHNIGFMAVDAIHRRHGFPAWRKRFAADVSEGSLGGDRTLLMKPQTFMNESGQSVGEAMRFLKLAPADVVAIYDELDLPPGKTRMKLGGGAGGHNGVRSLIAHLGDGFRRLRIGIGHPGHKDRVHGYVLHDFGKADEDWLAPLLAAIAENAPLLAEGKDPTFANRVHRAVEPEVDTEIAVRPTKPAKTPAKAKSGEPGPDEGGDAPGDGPFAAGLKRLLGK